MTERPLRILLISARADVGGGPFHVDLLARYLPPNIERWIACPDEEPYASAWKREPAVRGIISIPRRRFSPGALFSLAKACRQWDIDIVHSHGKGAGIYSRLLKLLRPRLRVIHTVHGVHVGQYGPLTRAVYLMAERILRHLTTAFVHVSEGEKRQCLALGISSASTSHVVYNGLPPTQASGHVVFAEFVVGHRPVILTLARFEYQKNMPLAMEIATLAQRVHPDWLFVWAGDGPGQAELQRQVKERKLTNVRFLGFTDKTANLLQVADVFLSTSLWEGLPYALIEACAAGVPIVASHVTGNDEVVIPNRNGFLYFLDNPGQAVTMINTILGDLELKARLSRGGKDLFLELFTLDQSIDHTVAVYRAVARKD